MTDTAIAAAAQAIRLAWQTNEVCDPVRSVLPAGSLEAAYAVQEVNTHYWIGQERRLVGRKVGLTSVAVQRQLGVDQPDYGMLYADMAVMDSEEIRFSRLLKPRVEAEVAFVLGEELNDERLTIVDIVNAVDYALPAIEIVDSRIRDWDIKIVDTIADNASSGLFVLGSSPRRLDEIDLRLAGMVLERRGEPVSVGAAAACLGNPLNAALWLARKMAQVGWPLGSGDIILSGALGPMVAVQPGDVFEARINGLGSVRAVFARED